MASQKPKSPDYEQALREARASVAWSTPIERGPYSQLHLNPAVAKTLNTPVNLGPFGSRLGDVAPVVNEIPPDQSRFDVFTRPRETALDYATLPAELLALVSPQSLKPKSPSSTSAPRRIIVSPTTAPESALPALENAKRLAQRLPLKERYNNPFIFRETGWYIDPIDKKWRFEVPEGPGTTVMAPEAAVKFNELEAREAPKFDMSLSELDEYINNSKKPNQFAAGRYEAVWHPSFDLPDADQPRIDTPTRVSFEKTAPTAYGTNAPYGGSFNAPEYGIGSLIKVRGGDLPTVEDVLRHEYQHDVSYQSGLPRGGSPEMVIGENLKNFQAKAQAYIDKLDQEIEAKSDEVFKLKSENSAYPPSDEYFKALDELTALKMERREYSQIPISQMPAQDIGYRAIKGEVDARNVQKRWNMTPEERKATPPWETEDIHPLLQWLNELSGPVNKP